MKAKISSLALIMLIPIAGCLMKDIGPGDDSSVSDWEKITPVIQARVRYVAAFAFSMDQIKPHKTAVCQATKKIIEFLDTYVDRDTNLKKLQAAVMQYLNTLDPSIREPVKIIVDMVLTEAFNYAWNHYEDLINQDQSLVALILADAVAQGLNEACGRTITIMGTLPNPKAKDMDIFTIPHETIGNH